MIQYSFTWVTWKNNFKRLSQQEFTLLCFTKSNCYNTDNRRISYRPYDITGKASKAMKSSQFISIEILFKKRLHHQKMSIDSTKKLERKVELETLLIFFSIGPKFKLPFGFKRSTVFFNSFYSAQLRVFLKFCSL